MADDWRIHITVEEQADGLLDRLGDVLGGEARELAEELEKRRLAVSRDGDEIFVYAPHGPDLRDFLALVERFNADINRAMDAADVKERFAQAGLEIVRYPPAEFGAFLRDEVPKWAAVVKSSGARVD